jgi:hypothetical protein
MHEKIKLEIHGARRTGTNYLKKLIEKNFSNVCFAEEENWKHGIIWEDKKVDAHIIISKNPYSWLNSVRKHFRLIREPKEITGILLENYFMKYGHWLTVLKDKNHLIIKYENLIIEKNLILENLGRKFGLKKKNKKFKNINNVVTSKKVGKKRFNPDYYLKKKYLNSLSNSDIENIEFFLKRFKFKKISDKLGHKIIKTKGRTSRTKIIDKLKEIINNLKTTFSYI